MTRYIFFFSFQFSFVLNLKEKKAALNNTANAQASAGPSTSDIAPIKMEVDELPTPQMDISDANKPPEIEVRKSITAEGVSLNR